MDKSPHYWIEVEPTTVEIVRLGKVNIRIGRIDGSHGVVASFVYANHAIDILETAKDKAEKLVGEFTSGKRKPNW